MECCPFPHTSPRPALVAVAVKDSAFEMLSCAPAGGGHAACLLALALQRGEGGGVRQQSPWLLPELPCAHAASPGAIRMGAAESHTSPGFPARRRRHPQCAQVRRRTPWPPLSCACRHKKAPLFVDAGPGPCCTPQCLCWPLRVNHVRPGWSRWGAVAGLGQEDWGWPGQWFSCRPTQHDDSWPGVCSNCRERPSAPSSPRRGATRPDPTALRGPG